MPTLMEQAIAKSFKANLKYNLNSDPAARPDLVSTDFSYFEQGSNASASTVGGNVFIKNVVDKKRYFYANTKASESVQLYFRCQFWNDETPFYRIWVRSGDHKGKLLGVSGSTLFASEDPGCLHVFRLIQRNADNTDWATVAIDEYKWDKPLLVQVLTDANKKVWTNIGIGSKYTPDSSDSGMWYAYVQTGLQQNCWRFDNVVAGADFEPTDAWGSGAFY